MTARAQISRLAFWNTGLTGRRGAGGLVVLLICVTSGAGASAGWRAPPGCENIKEICIEGEAERRIEGYWITRECWRKRQVYSCPATGPAGACAPLTRSPDCTRSGVECVQRDGAGVCITETSSYRCTAPVRSAGIRLMGRGEGIPDNPVRQGLQCGLEFWCPREEGMEKRICEYTAASGNNPDFGKAAAWMGLLLQMGMEKVEDALTIFKGEAHSCSRAIAGVRNCCRDKGWGRKLYACPSEAKTLGLARENKRAVYVGEYCARKILRCLRTKEVYCVFRSKFSRLLQVQARQQFGMVWGTARNPDCRPLTLDQLVRIDFSTIDMSEFYGDLTARAQDNAKKSVTPSRIQSRIQNYYHINR